jgi:pullulanase
MENNTLVIHYHRYDNKYDGWTLWIWFEGISIEINDAQKDKFGLIFNIDIPLYPSIWQIGFLPKYKNWGKKDEPDRLWNWSLPNEIWILEGNESIFIKKPFIDPFIRTAYLDSPKEIIAILTTRVYKKDVASLSPYLLLKDQTRIVPSVILLKDDPRIIRLITPKRIDIDMLPALLYMQGFRPGALHLRKILDSDEFISDESLGVCYTKMETKFSVYSPAAQEIKLRLYDQTQDGKPVIYNLSKGNRGVWSKVISGDLIGKYYTYHVNGFSDYDPDKEILDPHVKCVTAYNGRGMIIDDHTAVKKQPDFPFQDAVIYEMHVRDFTIDEYSGVSQKGKYLGFIEQGTTIPGTKIATALDHLLELGINTVQLMPIQNFEHDQLSGKYFWGYMPVNYNSPDGWYATNPYNDSRIREFKKLVDQLHKRGIKVIMDVVYNHTAEGNPQIRYNFNGVLPNFYYRTHADGSYWNGSGCGNELRTENPMVRRFIVESLKYWIETYRIDGFRFDLLGLMDIITIKEIIHTLREIYPNIFLYGEPWGGGETPFSPIISKGTQRGEGFAVFNDNFRDALRGPWYNNKMPGYIQNGEYVEQVKKGIIGSISDFTDSPLETINYISCHDGQTLWDHITCSTVNNADVTYEHKKLSYKFAMAILLTSQGVPFIHGGEEFLRSKFGSHNSYNQSDEINKIRWELKKINKDIFNYVKGLIRLRKEHPMFRMSELKQIKESFIFFENVPDRCIAYRIKRGISQDKWHEVLVLINPNKQPSTFNIPQGNWHVVVNKDMAGIKTIEIINRASIMADAISMMVMYR